MATASTFLEPLAGLDAALFAALNVDGGTAADALATVLSAPAFGIACGLLAVGALVFRLRRRALRPALALALAVAVTDFAGDKLLRPTFERTRPCYALPTESVRWIAPAANRGSLPSLHAANFFAMAVVTTRALPATGPLAFLVAALVALSRIYVGVHWPGDVLAGALWGTAVALAAWWSVGRRPGPRH